MSIWELLLGSDITRELSTNKLFNIQPPKAIYSILFLGAMDIVKVDLQGSEAGKKLVESLHNTGFAIVTNHGIDPTTFRSMANHWGEQFFAENNETKLEYKFGTTQDGYFPFLTENAKGFEAKDLKEFFHYYKWGKCPTVLSEETEYLHGKLVETGAHILDLLDKNIHESIGNKFSMPLTEMVTNSRGNLLRIIHYPPISEIVPTGSVRAAAHGDINLITLLFAGHQRGLQVQSMEGTWHDVESGESDIVINTGDMLNECSSGYFPSTIHRVVNPVDDLRNCSRYTMPLFLHPNESVVLSERYTAGSFLSERLKEIGLEK